MTSLAGTFGNSQAGGFKGSLEGTLLGRVINDPEAAMQAFGAFARGTVNNGLKFAADAGKVVVQTFSRRPGMPFADKELEEGVEKPAHKGKTKPGAMPRPAPA